MTNDRHIVLGVTGSIAAYKAVELVRLFADRSIRVSVMMTESATKYVGPLTFQALTGRPVAHGRFEDLSTEVFQHIDLARDADAILIAPCTANVMAKLAHGIADDVLTSTVLASAAPLLIAPAMNHNMWENAATQANRRVLLDRGVHVLDVDHGELACGTVGPGRLADLDAIIGAVDHVIGA